jgi:signal transduction histidine kinase
LLPSKLVPFRRIKDPERLQALIEAMLLIEADVDLPGVLRDIIQAAADLVGAHYGALGVLDETHTGLADFITVGVDAEARAQIGELPEGRGILGVLIRDPVPLRLTDLADHPNSVGFPPGHPPMRSFLGVPVLVRGDLYGNLYLCDKHDGAEFTDEDEDVVLALGTAAGLVIDKARLHARLRELTLAEERERMARNLHDTVIQRLFAIGLGLQGTARLIPSEDGKARVEELIDELDVTVRQIRTTIFAISRSHRSASNQGLRREILDVIDEATGRLGLDVRIDFEGPIDTAVGETTAEHLLFSLREAISNVVRHAGASHADVEVEVNVGPDALVLRVADNGVGVTEGARSLGRGLVNLGERAQLLGGSCRIRRRAEGGSELEWSIRELG